MKSVFSIHYDVIIIGGGATGAGVARDCSRRGLKTLLLERSDFATGATGRNHGLLHSGARYAVTDRESAEECIRENEILKRIASHCVEQTEGLFITLPEDDLNYQETFVRACTEAGIRTEVLDPIEALLLEPSLNPAIQGAVKVPDGSIDPFRLTISNILDAKYHGATICSYHEVTGFITEQAHITGLYVLNRKSGEESAVYGCMVVNAAGIWGQHLTELANVRVNMLPAKGALLIFAHRMNQLVLNRCRKPADADILVPGDTISLIGTTSCHIPYNEIDHMSVSPEEVNILISEGSKLVPALEQTRILRAYAGVRPLVASDNDPTGRNISRGIVLIDHAERDGLEGFITITGGKLMTYRLMAEKATDLVCKKAGIIVASTTTKESLPRSREDMEEINRKIISLPSLQRQSAIYRHGGMAGRFSENTLQENSLVCECEEVSVGEVKYALEELNVKSLVDLRRRTRMGMGTCQGELCACRAAGIMSEMDAFSTKQTLSDLASFLNERWKGIYPVGWGDTLRESEYTAWVYQSMCGLKQEDTKEQPDEI